jgi:hypothetical protein
MQHAETKKWGFNVVANTVEQHKPPSGFQHSIPFINYPGPECEGSKLLQNVTKLFTKQHPEQLGFSPTLPREHQIWQMLAS